MINKKLLLPVLLIPSIFLSAQKGIDGLINAEKKFAGYSVIHGTKEAFLKFADSSGIVFDSGKPVNAIEFWNKKEKRPGLLNWSPKFAAVAASGDFGYTSGPWTFIMNDTIVAMGLYSTVWHIDKNGEWKFLVDLGVNNLPANDISTHFTVDPTDPTYYHDNLISLIKAEKKFIRQTKKSGFKGWKRKEFYFRNMTGSMMTVLERNGRFPAIDGDAYQGSIANMPKRIEYSIKGSAMAPTNDLGYIYGTTLINDKTDNYLRIWRKEKDGWKIVLEVLRY
jgi:hypothetical protein